MDFPGGTAVKNLPANAGDMGSRPGQGRSHMPQNNLARAPQLLSLGSRAHEPQLLSLCATTTEACKTQLLKPACSSTRVPQLLSPHATTTEAHAPRARAPQQEKPLP